MGGGARSNCPHCIRSRLPWVDSPHNAAPLPPSVTCLDVPAGRSHSWHDDGGLKWRVLKAWATDFEKLHGREPTLWLE